MAISPIIERELRCAARESRTYWVRLITGGAAVLFLICLLWIARVSRLRTSDIFEALSVVSFLYCLLAGFIRTADCICREKQDDTLGLLFLTPLKSRHIVGGKLLANSIHAALSLAALLPILAIPLLMGGTTLGQFGRLALSLGNTLFFSLAVGLFYSSAARNSIRAAAGAFACTLLFSFLLPVFAEVVRRYYAAPEVAVWINRLSPSYAHMNAIASLPAADAELAFCMVHGLGWLFFGLATVRTARSWRDTASFAGWRTPSLKRGFAAYKQALHRLRPALRGRNPFYWLDARKPLGSPEMLFVTFVSVILTFALAKRLAGWFGGYVPLEGYMICWIWLCLFLHAVMILFAAGISGRRFAEDKRSGALELILSTPSTVAEIVRGQGMAILRQIAGPGLALLFIHGLFLWVVGLLFEQESGRAIGTLTLLRALVDPEVARSVGMDWQVVFVALSLAAAGAGLVLHWITLGLVGMWLGLRMKRPWQAPWLALFLVFFPPWFIFFSVVMVFAEVSIFMSRWSDTETFWFFFKLAVVLNITNDLLLCTWATFRLHRSFRYQATARYQPPLPRDWRKIGRIALAATILVAGLIGYFYGIETWRGKREWIRLVQGEAKEGNSLRFASLAPPPVPKEQNFAEINLFAGLNFEQPETYVPLLVPGSQSATSGPIAFQLQALAGQQPGRLHSAFGNWMVQTKTHLNLWALFFGSDLSMNSFGASDILARLKVFDQTLAALQEGAKRSFSRFPIAYEKGGRASMPHLVVLGHAAEILKLRALARLGANQPDAALEDILLMLRLADALLPEPYLGSQTIAQNIIQHAIQPFWEGLAACQWSESHLRSMEERLARINLFPPWKLAQRGEILRQIEVWQQLFEPPAPEMSWNERRAHAILARVYPRGWAYRNQAALWRAFKEEIDSWITPDMKHLPRDRIDRLFGAERPNLHGDPRFFNRGIASSLAQTARLQASLSMARTASFLERCRMAKGAYPETLEALVPEFTAELPPDPVSDGPLRYRPDPVRRILLYSVGLDGIDDGGGKRFREDDWVWSYPKEPY